MIRSTSIIDHDHDSTLTSHFPFATMLETFRRKKLQQSCFVTTKPLFIQFRFHKRPICSCSLSLDNAQDLHPLFSNEKTIKDFLQHSWGKRPVLFRQLFRSFQSPISPDELAGLACEPTADARIIQGGHESMKDENYTLQLGPFTADTFETLPPSHWTLLVRHVDQYVPPVSDMLSKFSFIPRWRMDDVMVSYASPGGSVGPHVDNYDVFLVQGAGKRKWYTTNTPIPPEDECLVSGLDVRVLKGSFQPDFEWVLKPGDALYVPPRIPHHGISLDEECMTFSVGFRAPTMANLVMGWAENVIDKHQLDNVFLTDETQDLIRTVGDSGCISQEAAQSAFRKVSDLFSETNQNKSRFSKWFAEEVSQQSKMDDESAIQPLSDEETARLLNVILSHDTTYETSANFGKIRQHESAVFTYQSDYDGNVSMYINGEQWKVSNINIAKFFCNSKCINAHQLVDFAAAEPSARDIFTLLLRQGLFYLEESFESEETIDE